MSAHQLKLLPDPLLPKESMDVAAGRTQAIWVEVRVPENARPGMYRGRIRLFWRGGEMSVPLRLTVFPITIPAERHLYVTNWFSPRAIASWYKAEAFSRRFWQLLGRFADDLAGHRQNVALVSLSEISITRRQDGRLSFDFSRWHIDVDQFGCVLCHLHLQSARWCGDPG